MTQANPATETDRAREQGQPRWLEWAARGVSLPRVDGPMAKLVVAATALAIVGIGVVDCATGPDLSLAGFYLLPVASVCVVVSPAAALLLSVESAIVWIGADAFLGHWPARNIPMSVVNAVLRLAILAFVVVLISALRQALERAKASEARTKEFLHVAAHQLRTPLAGISASAESLAFDLPEATRARLLTNLAAEASRAGRLAGSLLRMARLGAGEPVALDPIDIEAICRSEVERAGATAPHLTFALSAPDGAVVVGHEASAREALGNVLDNAVRHAATRVDVVLRAVGDDRWCIEIKDDGSGVPAGYEQMIFDQFVSVDDAGGSGLGLPIARGMMHVQRGHLEYRDDAFVFTFERASESGRRPPTAERGPWVPVDAVSHRGDGDGTLAR